MASVPGAPLFQTVRSTRKRRGANSFIQMWFSGVAPLLGEVGVIGASAPFPFGYWLRLTSRAVCRFWSAMVAQGEHACQLEPASIQGLFTLNTVSLLD